ncbi:A24 family peptidase [Cupriavidus sp. IDO]|uniref:A24 family peptidase n=1 Tax=Cupriavidus sp. IDO TaxID=1539142 RepID=UPI00057961CF|nr:prepilin peptidase [Cupriavidus sp. IDO]KWR89534.1 peptidase A24 [Cupriavidus sp. IDO]
MSATSNLSPFLGPVAIAIVLTAAAIDLHRRRIPNWLTFGAWMLALPVQIAIHGAPGGTADWALGWLTGFGIFLPFYVLGGMAAGDVKLMAATGAWLGATMAFQIALTTFLLGGAWAIVLVLKSRQQGQLVRNIGGILRTGENGPSVGSIPYGVAIAAGTLATLFAGK